MPIRSKSGDKTPSPLQGVLEWPAWTRPAPGVMARGGSTTSAPATPVSKSWVVIRSCVQPARGQALFGRRFMVKALRRNGARSRRDDPSRNAYLGAWERPAHVGSVAALSGFGLTLRRQTQGQLHPIVRVGYPKIRQRYPKKPHP